MDWIQLLRDLPAAKLRVEHHPRTPRYVRAAAKLPYVLRSATFLGAQAAEHRDAVEVAIWSPPGHGKGAGLYCCFRVFLVGSVVSDAVLFCFYDGKEGSPSLKSLESAWSYARQQGFGAVGDHAEDAGVDEDVDDG